MTSPPWVSRWSTPEGKAVRARVLEALRAPGGLHANPQDALWPDPQDGRADLRGIDLRFQSLQGVNLSFARLDGAQLDEADLRGARLEHATLDDASLLEVKLATARLSGLNARHADFRRADLIEADLSRANLAGASFRLANLRGALLSSASLAGADLMGAHLYLCDLEGAHLEASLRKRTRRGWAHRAGFPTFEDALSSYRDALTLVSPRMVDVAAVSLARSPRPALEVVSLLHEPNWRAQIWGALAALARPEGLASLLWERVDAFSFVVPQLVVAAFLVDPEFHAHAHARLRGDVPSFQPHGKSIGAIAALHALKLEGKNHDVCRAAWTREDPEAREGGRHASEWLQRSLKVDRGYQAKWRAGALTEASAETAP